MKLITLAALAAMSSMANAQSNITIYGLLDAGVTVYSKVANATGSGRAVQLDTGVAQGSRLGFRGTEDLGGGLSAIFTLENGYNVDTGTLGQGGLIFGRQAFVGLKNQHGAITLGRQYDFMGDLAGYSSGALTPSGLIAWNLHSNAAAGFALDDRVWGDWTNNAIKVTASFGALTAGVMYGLGETPGSMATNSTWSAGAEYNQGNLSIGAATTHIRDAVPGQDKAIYGLGTRYSIAPFTLFGIVTQAKFTEGAAPKVTTYEAGLTYALTPAITLGAAYEHQKRNNGVDSANTFLLSADYALSRRTDVYTVLGYNRDKAFPAVALAALGGPSDSDHQTALRVGIRHRF